MNFKQNLAYSIAYAGLVLPATASAGSGSDCGGRGIAFIILPILGFFGIIAVLELVILLATLLFFLTTRGLADNLSKRQRKTYRKLGYWHLGLLSVAIISYGPLTGLLPCADRPSNKLLNFDDYFIIGVVASIIMAVLASGVACLWRGWRSNAAGV